MAVFTTAWLFYASIWILRGVILVNGKGEPRIRGNPKKEYRVYVGDSVRLKCPVTGTKAPQSNRTLVVWGKKLKGRKKPDYIQNTLRKWSRFLLNSGKHLKIVSVRQQDAGWYRCIAKNEFGSVNLDIRLKVLKGPRIKTKGRPPKFNKRSPPKVQTYMTGQTAKLRCHSTGDPDPNVLWFKNGKSYGVNKRTSIAADGWTLNLRYLTVDDSGKYTCRVSNKLGTINRTFTVRVKPRTWEPLIEEPAKKNFTVGLGRSVKFECKTTSVKGLSFDWKWRGKYARNASRSLHSSNSKRSRSKYIANFTRTLGVSSKLFEFDGFLVVRNVRKEDEGRYTCVARNAHGTDQMDYYLRVKERALDSWTALPPQEPTTTGSPSHRKSLRVDRPIPVMKVVVLTVSIVIALSFIAMFVICCHIQRKNLEKQYVIEYEPQGVFRTFQGDNGVHQEIQKHELSGQWTCNYSSEEPLKTCHSAYSSTETDQNSSESCTYSKTENESLSSEEMCFADSRVSLPTTLNMCMTNARDAMPEFQNAHYSLPRSPPGSMIGVQHSGILSRGVWAPGVSANEDGTSSGNESSLDNSPKNSSPQRSRESIV